jgi:hypothetical protein
MNYDLIGLTELIICIFVIVFTLITVIFIYNKSKIFKDGAIKKIILQLGLFILLLMLGHEIYELSHWFNVGEFLEEIFEYSGYTLIFISFLILINIIFIGKRFNQIMAVNSNRKDVSESIENKMISESKKNNRS